MTTQTQTQTATHDYTPNDKPAPRFHDAPLCSSCGGYKLARIHDTDAVIQSWSHTRKGLILGRLLRRDGDWAEIRLARDHKLDYSAPANRGRTDRAGSTITVSARLLTLLSD
jgi:hypothetical protein